MHWHASVDNVLLYGISAIIVINGVRILGSLLVSRGGKMETVGRSLVALT